MLTLTDDERLRAAIPLAMLLAVPAWLGVYMAFLWFSRMK